MIFLDTGPLIYLLEDHPEFADVVEHYLIAALDAKTPLVTSALTVHEYTVGPAGSARAGLVTDLEIALAQLQAPAVPITSEIAVLAAQIRNQFPAFAAIDSMQLAAAQTLECTTFFTNDKQLRQFDGLEVVLVAGLQRQ